DQAFAAVLELVAGDQTVEHAPDRLADPFPQLRTGAGRGVVQRFDQVAGGAQALFQGHSGLPTARLPRLIVTKVRCLFKQGRVTILGRYVSAEMTQRLELI